MMRGPTYDDAYISRKMSSMHGPTFAPPGGYGRPPMGGYMQSEGKETKTEKRTEKKTEREVKKREGSPTVPYFWPEHENDLKERKKGWYRVDFGPQSVTQMWYLPTITDRLNFLKRHKDSNPHEPFQTPSPFPVEDDKNRSSEYWKVQRQKFPSTTREQRKSRPLINMGSVPIPKVITRRSLSIAPNPYKQIPRPGLMPSIGYEPTRSLSQPPTGAAGYPGRVTSYISGYPMGPPPPRMVPRMAPAYPSYYDYDYGYGGGYGYPSHGYGYGYAPPPPRMSRYESYMDDDVLEPTYGSRYRSRVPETLEEMDIRDKASARPHPPAQAGPHAAPPPSALALRDYPPLSVNDVDEDWSPQQRRPRKAHLQSSPGIEPPAHTYVPGETEGDRHLAKMQARYPSLSEPQMLQDHVDKMRIRLKSIAFSLDPSGPVPDIIVPERPKKGVDGDKKYTQALEFNELPKLASRRQRYYPEDDYIKDNLRIKCLSHYKTTRTAADYWKPKQYNPDDYKVASESTSRYDKLAGAKWEEPDTVFGTQTDKKPYSKVETGSSFFSTYGYTSRKKDYLAEKDTGHVRFSSSALKPLTDGTSEDTDDKKERRRKKKSKERDVSDALAIESGALSSTTPAAPSDLSTSEADKEVDKEASIGDDEGLDEKERKKLEKKKRKAEREAAAKAAMEAELAALAAAEAELARLEAESSSLKTDSPAEVSAPAETPAPAAPAEETPSAPAPAPAEPATEVKSESAADKCESSTEVVVCEGVSVTPESLSELPPPEPPLQVPPQEEIIEQMPVEVEEAPKVLEEPHVESQNEIPQMESHTEEPPTKPLAEDVQVEPVAEVTQVEKPQAEVNVEQTQPELPSESQVEEVNVEPQTESSLEPQVEPQMDEPQVEPQVEECAPPAVDEAAVVEESAKEAVTETPPADGGVSAETETPPAVGGAEDLGTEVDDAAAAGGEEEQQSATAAFDTTDIDTTFGGGHDEGLQDTITLPAETGGEALFDDSTDAAAAAAAAAATSALPSSANRSEEDLLE